MAGAAGLVVVFGRRPQHARGPWLWSTPSGRRCFRAVRVPCSEGVDWSVSARRWIATSGQLDGPAGRDVCGEFLQRRRGQANAQRREGVAQHALDLRRGSAALTAGERPQHGLGVAAPLLFHLTADAGAPWCPAGGGASRYRRGSSSDLLYRTHVRVNVGHGRAGRPTTRRGAGPGRAATCCRRRRPRRRARFARLCVARRRQPRPRCCGVVRGNCAGISRRGNSRGQPAEDDARERRMDGGLRSGGLRTGCPQAGGRSGSCPHVGACPWSGGLGFPGSSVCGAIRGSKVPLGPLLPVLMR